MISEACGGLLTRVNEQWIWREEEIAWSRADELVARLLLGLSAMGNQLA